MASPTISFATVVENATNSQVVSDTATFVFSENESNPSLTLTNCTATTPEAVVVTATVAGAVTTSANVTLASANDDIYVGMAVTGTDVPAGTTVSGISGTALTLSASVTLADETGLTFDNERKYTATITPSSVGTVTVAVSTSTFSWYNGTLDVTITGAPSTVSNETSVTLIFTLTGSSADFVSAPVTITPALATLGVLTASTNNTVFTGTLNLEDVPEDNNTPVNIDVAAGEFTDVGGASNTAATQVSFTHDNKAPTLGAATINGKDTSQTLFSGDATDLVLQFSEDMNLTNLTNAITVTGATKGNVSEDTSTNPNTYTVQLTYPTAKGDSHSIGVAIANTATDEAGNSFAGTTLTWTYDNRGGSATVSGVTNGGSSNADSVSLTFALTEASTDFSKDDVTVSHGVLGDLANVHGGVVFTGTLDLTDGTAVADGETVTVKVEADKYTGANGNSNALGNTLSWTYDSTKPGVTITQTQIDSLVFKAADGTEDASGVKYYNVEAVANVTFKLSEASTDFDESSVTVTGGSLSAFNGSGDEYTATVTANGENAVSVDVAADAFTDAAGNTNTRATNNTGATSALEWTYDTTAPQVSSIEVTQNPTADNGSNATLEFTLSEASTDFTNTNVTITPNVGTLGGLTASENNTVFTGTLDLTAWTSGDGDVSISVGADEFTDRAGNTNASNVGATATIVVDVTRPTVNITKSNGNALDSVVNGDVTSIDLKFTLSEDAGNSTAFEASDISVDYGAIASFQGSGTEYTATLNLQAGTQQPASDENTTVTITIAEGGFQDATGNQNAAATASFTVDPALLIGSPFVTASISDAADGTYSGLSDEDRTRTGNFAKFEIAFSEAIQDGQETPITASRFASTYVSITGGATLNSSSEAGNTYTLIYQANSDATYGFALQSISSIVDAHGNDLETGYSISWERDTTVAAPVITARKTDANGDIIASSGGRTEESVTHITVAAITDGGVDATLSYAISPATATLSAASGAGPITVTHNETETETYTLTVTATDSLGNTSNSTFTWTHDSEKPTVTVALTSGGTNLVAYASTTLATSFPLTVTPSETLVGFAASDLTATHGGTVTESDGTYSLDFGAAPAHDTSVVISVVANAFTDEAGNGNAAADLLTLTYKSQRPTVAVTTVGTPQYNTASLKFTFSEAVTGFSADDVTVPANTVLGALSASGDSKVFTGELTIQEAVVHGATLTVSVPEGVCTNSVGNVNAASTTDASWTHDEQAPGAPSVTNTVGNINVATISVTLADDVDRWEYSVDSGANWSAGTGTSFTLNEGVYAANDIQVRQYDAAGNLSSVAVVNNNAQLTIDTTAPSAATVARTGDDTDGFSNVALVTVSDVEEGSTWAYSVDDGSTWSDEQAHTVTTFSLGDAIYGANDVYVRVTDPAGNTSTFAVVNSAVLTIDTVAASVTMAMTLGGGTFASASATATRGPFVATFTANAGLAALASATAQLTGPAGFTALDFSSADGTAEASKITLAGDGLSGAIPSITLAGSDPDGAYTLTLTHTDLAGNQADVAFSWTLDTTAATISNFLANGDKASGFSTNVRTVTFAFDASEALASISAQVTGPGGYDEAATAVTLDGDALGGTMSHTLAGGDADGTYTLTLTHTDAQGNANSSSTFQWTLDTAAPSVLSITTTAGTAITRGDSSRDVGVTSVPLTIQLSQASTDFANTDLSVTGDKGTIAALTTSDNITFTGTLDLSQGNAIASGDAIVVSVAAAAFTDAAGNDNTATGVGSGSLVFTYDITAPTVQSLAVVNGDDSAFGNDGTNDRTKQTTVKATVTLSEKAQAAPVMLLQRTRGGATATLTPPTLTSTDNTVWTATLDLSGEVENDDTLALSTVAGFTDYAGNANTATASRSWVYDSAVPVMTLDVTASGDNDTFSAIANLKTRLRYLKFVLTVPSDTKDAGAFFTATTPTLTISGGSDALASHLVSFSADSATQYTYLVDMLKDGSGYASSAQAGDSWTFTLPASFGGAQFQDVALNDGVALDYAFTFDDQRPSISAFAAYRASVDANNAHSAGDRTNAETMVFVFETNEATDLALSNVAIAAGGLTQAQVGTPSLSTAGNVHTLTYNLATTDANARAGDTYTLTIGADGQRFADLSTGFENDTAQTFSWVYDNTKPSVTISSAAVDARQTETGAAAKHYNAAAVVTFTLSEDSATFAAGDVTVSNAQMSGFDGSGSVYTATITPDTEGPVTVNVDADVFTDLAGNQNTAATQYGWTHDESDPTPTLALGGSESDLTRTLTITVPSASADLTTNDVTVSNATLGALSTADAGATYTGTLTVASGDTADPSQNLANGSTVTVEIAAGTFTDLAGNANLASAQTSYIFDSVAPTVSSMTTGLAGATNVAATTVTITFSEAVQNFTVDDLVFTNAAGKTHVDGAESETIDAATIAGGLSNFTNVDPAQNNVYTVVATAPHDPALVEYTVAIKSDAALQDMNGKAYAYDATDKASWTFDSLHPVLQQGTMLPVELEEGETAWADGAALSRTTLGSVPLTRHPKVAFKFLFSEDVSNFAIEDITVTNGTPSDFNGSGSEYTVVVTPDANAEVTVATTQAYEDALGNSSEVSYTYTFQHDATAPTAAITTTNPKINATANRAKDTLVPIKITLSEAAHDAPSLTLSHGALSSALTASSNDTVWEGTLDLTAGTAASDGDTVEVKVAAGDAEDRAGNTSAADASLSWVFDTSSPSVAISASIAADQFAGAIATPSAVFSGGRSRANVYTLSFTASEFSENFAIGDVTYSHGTLSAFTPPADPGADNSAAAVYTATLTLDDTSSGKNAAANGDSVSVSVSASAFTDRAGNDNTASAGFTWVFDAAQPTIGIASNKTGGLTGLLRSSQAVFGTHQLTFTLPSVDFDINETVTVATTTASVALASADARIVAGMVVTGVNVAAGTTVAAIDGTALTLSQAPSAELSANATLHFSTAPFLPSHVSILKGDGSSALATPLASAWASQSDGAGTYTIGATLADLADEETVTVSVAADQFRDDAGNLNAAATSLTWTNDETAPTIASVTVTSTADAAVTDATADSAARDDTRANLSAYKVTYTLSERSAQFVNTAATAFSANALTLVNLTQTAAPATSDNGLTYVATYTADASDVECSITEKANTYDDEAGNANTGSAELVRWTHDVTAPTISNVAFDAANPGTTSTVVANKDTVDQTVTLWFQISEPSADFLPSDLTLTNLTLAGADAAAWDTDAAASSAYEGAATETRTYRKIFTVDDEGECKVAIAADAFHDSAGNGNAESADIITFTSDTTGPTIIIGGESTTEGTSNDTWATLYLVSNEPVQDHPNAAADQQPIEFATSMVTVNNALNGHVTNFRQHANHPAVATYYLEWEPIATKTVYGSVTIDIAADQFTDEAGNFNLASTPRTWTFDKLRPTITLSGDDVDLANYANVKNAVGVSYAEVPIKFTASEATTSFASHEVTKSDASGNNAGYISQTDWSSGNQVYTAKIQLGPVTTTRTEYTIRVDANKFTDAAGNPNAVSNTISVRYDPETPAVTMSAVDSGSDSVGEFTRTNDPAITYTIATTRAPVAFFGATLTAYDRAAGSSASTNTGSLAHKSTSFAGDLTHATFRQVKFGDNNATVSSYDSRSMSIGADHFRVNVTADSASRAWGDLRLYKDGAYYGGDLRHDSGSTYRSTQQLEYHWVIREDGTTGAWREQVNPPGGGAFYLASDLNTEVANAWNGTAWDVAPTAAGTYTIYPSDATVVLQVDEFSVASWGGDAPAASAPYAVVEGGAIRATLEYHRTEGGNFVFRLEPGWSIPTLTGVTVHPATEFTYTSNLTASTAAVYELTVAAGAFAGRSGMDNAAKTFSLTYDPLAEETSPAPSISLNSVSISQTQTTVNYTVAGLDDQVTTFTATLTAGLHTKLDTVVDGTLETQLGQIKAATLTVADFNTNKSVGLTADEQTELSEAIVRFGAETKATAQFFANGVTYTDGPSYALTNGTYTVTWNAVSTGLLTSNLLFEDELGNTGSSVGPSETLPDASVADFSGKLIVSGTGQVNTFNTGRLVFS